MPNKTIYVADDDLPLLQRAQELVGGNLSGAVVTALKRFIELEEGKLEGFEEIVLRVGHNGARQVRFQGVLLVEHRDVGYERMEQLRVFRSRKDKFVLHEQYANWSEYPESANWLRDLKNWRRMLGIEHDWGDYVLTVFDTVEELKGKIPDSLYGRVSDIAQHAPIEELDI